MKEAIFKYIKSKGFKPIRVTDLKRILNVTTENIDEFLKYLFELEIEGKIIGNDEDNTYQIVPEDFLYIHGFVELSNRNKLFCKYANGTIIMIKNASDYNVEPGDFVYLELLPNSKHPKNFDGNIVRLVKKPKIYQSGIFCQGILMKDNIYSQNYIIFNNRKYYILENSLNGAFTGDEVSVFLDSDDNKGIAKVVSIIKRKSDEHLFYVDNDLKIHICGTSDIKINMFYLPNDIKPDTYFVGKIDGDIVSFVKTVDDVNELDKNIKLYAYERGIPFDFPDDVLSESDKLNGNITEEEIIKREDFRNLTTFTIDGLNAKDLDDAVSIQKLADRYRLYVHIADVSHYVKIDSKLFTEALRRTTSIYPTGTVIPMLPTRLSNELCSLNPNEDKLTKTCVVDISFSGEILDYYVTNSIINSDIRMVYDDVNNIFRNNTKNLDRYMPFIPDLMVMNELSKILQKRKNNRGFLNLEDDEFEFKFDENGEVIDVTIRKRGDAEYLIENFMLLVNEVISAYVFNLDGPFIFRNHEAPSIDQFEKMRFRLKDMSALMPHIKKFDSPKILAGKLKKLYQGKSEEEKKQINKIILRCLNRANYSDSNIGHFGLALPMYGMFTSPIRRLPDLLNHTIVGAIIEGDISTLEKCRKKFEEYASICSAKQVDADEFEQYINNYALKHLLQEKDEYYDATITFISGSNIYIKIKDSITGVIKFRSNKYKIGDIIPVKFFDIDKENDEIIFTIAKNYEKGNDKNVKYKRK